MERLRITYVFDGLVLVSLVWYGFTSVYCYLTYLKSDLEAVNEETS